MRTLTGVLLSCFAACTFEPIEFELDLDPGGAGVVVYDDGTMVRVAGCPDQAFLGCNPPAPGDEMQVTADGVSYDAPASTEGSIPDQLLGVFRDGPFQISVPRPPDGTLTISLSGSDTTVILPESFEVGTLPATISRSAGAVEIDHVETPGSDTVAVMITTCGTRERSDLFTKTDSGALTLTFESFVNDGACGHEVHVDRTISSFVAGISVTTVRIEKQFMMSEP